MNEQERRSELGQFLRVHRERISPDLFGFPRGTRRRTPGLRREELAIAAGVGTTWYTWLEQGRDITVSAPMLESLARVLQLDEDEQAHLFILARKQLPATPFPFEQFADPTLQTILDAIDIYPAYILNSRADFVAWNQAASQVYTDFSTLSLLERNFLWFLFTNREYRAQLVNWEEEAHSALALFRASTQRYIGEDWLTHMITDLKRLSPEFCAWWSWHDVQTTHKGQKQINHPRVGLLIMNTTTFQLTEHPGLRMVVDTASAETDTRAKLIALSLTD
jgi:transcriptional regulator with XRE-family HTH domain